MPTKVFQPDSPEVTAFRERIFTEDLKLPASLMGEITYENKDQYNPFAYWYCDQKFLSNGFDQVLLYYYEGEAASLVCGTHYNKHLYRASQMYYILKSFRGRPGANTFPYKKDGQFPLQIERAKELGCKAVFVAIHAYNKKYEMAWQVAKDDIVGPGIMPLSERTHTAKDFVFCDKEYELMYVKQKIFYYDIYKTGVDFDALWNSSE